MSKVISVPEELYNKAADYAAKENVSVEEFVTALLSKQLASRDSIVSRARLFNRDDLDRALSAIPDVEPEEHDRL
jgi:hypothetical protein